MASSIFLIDEHNRMRRLGSAAYESEDVLQRLVADFPRVLAAVGESEGDLLLVRREQGVPDSEGAGPRWSLDHLFIDRDAVPVLVEVKRATDTRARREVVAQMLDYVANGVIYWPLGEIIDGFEENCRALGLDSNARLRDFLGADEDADAFWKQVEANLRAGRVRMVFLADVIAKELRRVVEFLNEQMRPAEVIAVEVAQYTSDSGLRTLVPKLVGDTERARGAKAARQDLPPISTDEWLDRLHDEQGQDARKAVEKFMSWFERHGGEFGVTKSQDAMFFRVPTEEGKKAWPFFTRLSGGRLEIALVYLKNRPRYRDEQPRRALLDAFNEIPGISLSTDNIGGWPAFPLRALLDEKIFAAFTSIASNVIREAAKAE